MNESMSNSKLGEFFINSLHEMYWCEFHLVEILSTMTYVSTSFCSLSRYTGNLGGMCTRMNKLPTSRLFSCQTI